MADIEIDDMIFGMNFFGKQNFEVMTYTEYKFVEPNFVQYTLEHPTTRDVYINIKMNMLIGTKSNNQVFSRVMVDIVDEKLEIEDEYGSNIILDLSERYGNDFGMDLGEIVSWLQDNEWPANYNGLDLDEVR